MRSASPSGYQAMRAELTIGIRMGVAGYGGYPPRDSFDTQVADDGADGTASSTVGI
jgi:hypothetical protein